MAITYVNRKKKTYYLHQGTTKTGKPKYYFAMKSKGNLADEIPEGFEIYENPNAQVFLRKIPPQVITDEEVAVVDKGMKQFGKVDRFIIDVKKDTIRIYTPDQNVPIIAKILEDTATSYGRSAEQIHQLLEESLTYSDDLRFVLVDQQKRLFQTQRYCYHGSIDDWIDIGSVDQLKNLVKSYVRHIGQDSFFDLY
jgi:hypothetical protein